MRFSNLLSLMVGVAFAVCAHAEPDPHAHHHATSADVRVSAASYDVPDVELRDEAGHVVRLRDLLARERPIALNFIYTSCTTVCPVMTATFLQMQKDLRTDPGRPLFVSISIDPDFDTAPVLAAYAHRFDARWTFLTGSAPDVVRVLRAFDAYRGNKTNHAALTVLRAPHGDKWTRIEGLAPSETLIAVWKDLVSS